MTKCLSCYSATDYKYLYGYNCYKNCPSHMYEDPADNVCRECSNNCAECETTSTYCTECELFYKLTDSNTCVTNSSYPWPFLCCTFLFTVAVCVCIILRRDTKFRESAIALVAWAEIGAWIAACALFDGAG